MLDASLENSGGYELLHLHRIQLLHNLMRIAATERCHLEAFELGFRILRYLGGSPQSLPAIVTWDPESIRRLPNDLVGGLFNQVVAEMALIVARPRISQHEFLAVASDYLQELKVSGYCQCPRAHAWLKLKTLFINDRLAFLRNCGAFLQDGYTQHPVLWFATSIDLVAICKESDMRSAHWLALDLTLEPMPIALRTALEALFLQTT
jgi:hypothetical protein